MNKLHRIIFATLVIVTSVMWLALFVRFLHKREQAALPGDTRTANLVATLKRENPTASINSLIFDDQQYFFPGVHVSRNLEYAQVNLEQALSCRRFVKLLHDIDEQSSDDKEMTCRQFYLKAFQLHTNAIQVILKIDDDPSSPPSKVSLMGTLEGICEAMFLTAHIGRRDLLSAQFTQLDQLRAEFRPLIDLHKSKYPMGVATMLEVSHAPDKRFEVNVLRLAALRTGNQRKLQEFDAQCEARKMQKKELPIVAWDARKTWFEWLETGEVSVDKMVLKLVMYDWPAEDYYNTKSQDETVSKLRVIVFK